MLDAKLDLNMLSSPVFFSITLLWSTTLNFGCTWAEKHTDLQSFEYLSPLQLPILAYAVYIRTVNWLFYLLCLGLWSSVVVTSHLTPCVLQRA